jgi:predicted AAA+ superfamily ATPase
LEADFSSVLYCSLDDLYFTENSLVDLSEKFVSNGGKYLFLDEVHRYPNWSQEIKNIYDDLPELKVVFTGSSMLKIRDSKGDLSRRAIFYDMPGLSLREFINLNLKTNFPAYSLKEILQNHVEIAQELKKQFKPLVYFKEFLQFGYFPFYQEYSHTFLQRVNEIVNITLDVDMMQIKGLNTSGLLKMKILLHIIAGLVPFKPNIVKLSERIGVNRNTLITYLKHLEEAGIINAIYSSTQGVGVLQKPEKIYLQNTCFNFALSENEPEIGTLRESFFFCMAEPKHKVSYTEKGDFMLEKKFVFEIGGKNKTAKQISGVSNSFIVADELETGYDRKIPLWLFGFLY